MSYEVEVDWWWWWWHWQRFRYQACRPGPNRPWRVLVATALIFLPARERGFCANPRIWGRLYKTWLQIEQTPEFKTRTFLHFQLSLVLHIVLLVYTWPPNSGVVWVRWRNCLCLTRQLFPPAAHHNDNGITSKCATESTNSINPKSTLNRLQHHLAASSQAPSSPQIMVKIKFSHEKQDSCHAAMAAGS